MASLIHSIGKTLNSTLNIRKTLPAVNHLLVKFAETSTSTASDDSEESILPPKLENIDISEEELAKKCDISYLRPYYRDVMFGKPNMKGSVTEKRLSKQRQFYGKYGDSSGIDPAVCFITREEMEELEEYERVAHPESIFEVRKRKLEELAEEKRQYKIREEHYAKAMATVKEHKEKIRQKILNKMAEAEVAQKKREALMEEVKRHFGYTIDPRDEKFQLVLQQKEMEQKKLAKEMRKKTKEERFMAKLAALETGIENKLDSKNKSDKKRKAVETEKSKNEDEEDESKYRDDEK